MKVVNDLHPDLIVKVDQLIKHCTEAGIAIGISECLRTIAEQDALYAKGRTEPGPKVTNCKGSTYSSMHQWGVAFDFFLRMDVDGDGNIVDDAYNDSTGLFKKVGQIGKNIGLEWGGDWKSIIDQPHFQLPNWGSTASKLKKMYGTPSAFIATWPKSGNQSQDTQDKVELIGKVTARRGLNVRTSPTTNSRLIFTLPYNSVVTVYDEAGSSWVLIKTDTGVHGYCFKAYLSISQKPATPVVTSPTNNATTPSYAKSEVIPAKSRKSSYIGKYAAIANLNMRNDVDTDRTRVLTVIPRGKVVQCWGYYTLCGTTPWFLVSYGKYTGYASSKYLEKR